MPFDGGFLHKISQEIDGLAGARVDKISQPARELIVLALRHPAGSRKLLLSASATAPKVHFTQLSLENPKAAPMFCMLLRKRLGGGRLVEVSQLGLDRVLTLTFECYNELGDLVRLSLVCEIMGRHSNVILVDGEGRIVDAVKRVDFVTSEARQVLPGLPYTPPPAQDKLSLLTQPAGEVARAVLDGRDIPLSKAVLERAQGLSPMVCREVSQFVCGGADLPVGRLTPAQGERLAFYLGVVATALRPDGGRPCLVRDDRGRAQDFCYLSPIQYPGDWTVEVLDSYSALVDQFFTGRDTAEEMRHKSARLHKQMTTLRDRLRRKLLAQEEDLTACAGRDTYKQWGDIISANLYAMARGDRVLEAENFFSPDGGTVKIPLDPMLTPAQNAQRYYGEYRKAATAEAKLRELMEKGRVELEYLESVLSQLERAGTTDELEGIREELLSQGYVRGEKGKNKKPLRLSPLRFVSSDGYTILCGRNNLQNDQLTLREAKGRDLWLHTQKIHGSHVILQSRGTDEFPLRTIEEAAVIAACHSAAGANADRFTKIPVDYTPVRFVKKPRGGRPGMVIYDTYETVLVGADHALAQSLLEG